MTRSLLVIFFSLFMLSCTASRWVVIDENAIDTNDEPELISERTILLLENEPDVDNPVMSFYPYRVTEKEYSQRVQTERTVQKYRPRWGFLTAGLAGAVFTAAVANTSFLGTTSSVSNRVLLNLTSGILAAVSVFNMEPTGEPIHTGEIELMRRSGNEVVADSTRQNTLDQEFMINLQINYKGNEVHSQSDLTLTNGSLDLNLASFAELIDEELDGNSVLEIQLLFNGTEQNYDIPINQFLLPHAKVNAPVAFLRNTPELLDINVITEVGIESSLQLIGEENDEWFRVRFGGSDVFLRQDRAEIEWISTAESGPATIVEFAEVPFGEIDVENSVPLLKQHNPADRALIITNGNIDEIDQRQYLDRDHRLFRFYMRYALQMNEDQIRTIQLNSENDWINELQNMPALDEDGSLVVYLSGFATMGESRVIQLQDVDDPGSENSVLTSIIFKEFERMNPESLFLFADLEFIQPDNGNQLASLRSITSLALQQTANQLLRELPNSVVLYSNRPGQTSSLYTGFGEENKRHHIFNYYLAEALKQRKTRMSDIIRHLENNVDFTSRRLHDSPQEIQAFGNFTLNIAQ